MNPFTNMELVRAIYDDRRRAAEASRRAAAARGRRAGAARTGAEIVIRQASRRDARRLERLAALDSAPTPSGPTLLAEMNGRLVAALPLSGGGAVADPFEPSAQLVEMLRLRAMQMRPAA